MTQSLRARAWCLQTLVLLRRQLRQRELPSVRVTAPQWAQPQHMVAVQAALTLGRASCLERSLVVQAWRAVYGPAPDVLVGVSAPSAGFRAHAWLDDEEDGSGFTVLHRVTAAKFTNRGDR